MIDKEFFEVLDGFDETYRFFYEDIDLCLRAKKQGGQCFLCGKSIISHSGGRTVNKNLTQNEANRYIKRNRRRTIEKNFTGWARLLRISILSLIHSILTIIDFFISHSAKINSLRSITKERPAALAGIFLARYQFAASFAKNKMVLDIGTGFGGGAYLLAQKGAKWVLGVDYSQDVVSHAKRNFILPNLEFKVLNALDILSLKKQFDVIIAFELIEHLPLGSYSTFAGNLKKILKPKGVCLVSTPNKFISSPKRKRPYNPYHQKEFTPREFFELFEPHFAKVRLFGIDCVNEDFLEKNKAVKKKLGNRLTTHLSRYRMTHKLLPLIPPWIKNKATSREHLPKLSASDFRISRKNIDKCEGLIAVCERKKPSH